MPFRFRKTIKLGKGLKLNLSKSGVSTSIGGRGATVNLGKRGVRTTVGMPGTGLSYTSSTPSSNASHPTSSNTNNPGCLSSLFGLLLFPFKLLIQILQTLFKPGSNRNIFAIL